MITPDESVIGANAPKLAKEATKRSDASLGGIEELYWVSPRKVIRGESFLSPHSLQSEQVALTDWLNLTFPFDASSFQLSYFVDHLNSYCQGVFGGLMDMKKGLHGYRHSFSFEHGGAKFAFGGQRGTAFLSLSGESCALIEDWHGMRHLIDHELRATITRWDGAVDDFTGTYSVDKALAWYREGLFNAGGNKPKMTQVGNWDSPDGSGRTLYIGRRKNGKLLRIYEKGKQLGDGSSPWVRWEVSLGKKSREIPSDVLIRPRSYIAGAYRCMSWVSDKACRIRTLRKSGAISYEQMISYARIAYGSLINVMLNVEGSPEAVIGQLICPGVPKRLETPYAAGVLEKKK